MEFITITEAANLTGKSIQTIRRMIKRKRIQVRRQKTPQGFNYMVDKYSLQAYLQNRDNQMNNQIMGMGSASAPLPYSPSYERRHAGLDETIFAREIDQLTTTIEKLVSQNEKDKDSFFGLIKTFQERIGVLENQIKLLEAPKKRWWQKTIW